MFIKFAAVFINTVISSQGVGLIAGTGIFIAVAPAVVGILAVGVFGKAVAAQAASTNTDLLSSTGFENVFFFTAALLFAAAGAVERAPVRVITNRGIVGGSCP